MNLHCNQIELRQTPTTITYMCMVQRDGTIEGQVTGNKAKQALQIYIQWVRGSLSGRVWTDKDDYEAAKQSVDEEVARVNKVLKSKTKLKVYVL